MPKAKSRTPAASKKPYSKSNKPPEIKKQTASDTTKSTRKGKDSHLYTDDNPSTTLHGTGFKDAATARHTLTLVSARSLLYQFQTINTMYNRAKHHPHPTEDMRAAMSVFLTWLDETYPSEKATRPEFKPVLKRDVVQRFLPRIEEEGIKAGWARMYVELERGKRLANTLMDEARPAGDDMVTVRDRGLVALTGGKTEDIEEDLWDEQGRRATRWHLRCIAFGWSPVGEARLKNLT